VTLFVIFPSGRTDHYSGKTGKNGRWERTFPIPPGTGSPDSDQALAIVRVHHKLTTRSIDLKFQLLPPARHR